MTLKSGLFGFLLAVIKVLGPFWSFCEREPLKDSKRVFLSQLSVGPSVAMEEIWITISGFSLSFSLLLLLREEVVAGGQETGTDLRVSFIAAQPQRVGKLLSARECRPGTLAIREPRIEEKSYLESCSMRGLQVDLYERR